MRKLLLVCLFFVGCSHGKVGNWDLTIVPFTRYIYMPASGLALGATAPTETRSDVWFGLGFDDANDEVNFKQEVPDDWDGASNMSLRIYWINEPGTAIATGKKVIWKSTYRCVSSTGVIDGGTIGSPAAVTYTQVEPGGTDKEMHISTITLAYDDGNQPLVVDYTCSFSLKRDTATEAGDTYAADAVLLAVELALTSNDIANH